MEAFRHLPVTSLEGVTHNFEQLQGEITRIEEAQTQQEGKTPIGAWTALTIETIKMQEVGAFQSVRVRSEHGSSARLRGALAPRAGKELKAGETMATLPTGLRPPGTVLLSIFENAMTITSAGVMTLSKNVAELVNIPLDGVTFNLT